MKSKEILREAERFFAKLNLYDSLGRLPIIDEVYPNHDGSEDPEAAATLMQLETRLNAIRQQCEDVIYKINCVLD